VNYGNKVIHIPVKMGPKKIGFYQVFRSEKGKFADLKKGPFLSLSEA
jgi:hypothetical protein